MIKNLLFRGAALKHDLKTYKVGLVQAKAYRVLKHQTASLLDQLEISSLDWALLGNLSEVKEGFKLGQAAELLGVEAPFVTVVVDALEKKGLIKKEASLEDKRVRLITLTNEGKKMVSKTETILQRNMKRLLKGASNDDIGSYMTVLKTIITNNPAPLVKVA